VYSRLETKNIVSQNIDRMMMS